MTDVFGQGRQAAGFLDDVLVAAETDTCSAVPVLEDDGGFASA